ncbi:hypothetical protein GCM10010329_23840 [Streptomyces spiroverticillatus]|uniref:Lipoprotein n=1 Tax=Streptomyces finlayi TaxID=67296 RepID=A0A919C8P6_9ACTN|nr:hypothetical protein GCM10010329_23840 [Streptomyces spiroverticillatus]GHC85798.1 hypothetical protein GCM10010334_16260 [Streptomyces finlayi]
MFRGKARVCVPLFAVVLLTAGCDDERKSDKASSGVSDVKDKASACVKALRLVELVPDPKKAEDYEKKGEDLRKLSEHVRDRDAAKAIREVAHQYGMARVEAARDFGRVAAWVKQTASNIKVLKEVCT